MTLSILKNIYALFYPIICISCHRHLTLNEHLICLSCRHDLPLTNFSFEKNNLIEKAFYGRCKIENATALFYFSKKGRIRRIIHELKYRNREDVGVFTGDWLAHEILASERFKGVECIIPVPLHAKKMKKRGYNQVTTFGKSLSTALKIPFYDHILVRVTSSKTQTKKLRFDRWKNVKEQYVVNNRLESENKHILLIDDIITTGATLESCCNAFSEIKNIKISIACIAYTK